MLQQTHGFRHVCPEGVRSLQTEVLRGDNAIFLLHQSGPTGFVIKEHKRRLPVKVHLGDRHTCSCTNFTMNAELCLHLCWTLLKKLKFAPEDPRSFQLGLASHDLSDHLADDKPTPTPAPTASTRRRDTKRRSDDEPDDAVVETSVRRRSIATSDTCPICLEGLLEKKAAVSHCRHGCGNAVHVGCMRVVAHHQVHEAGVARRAPLAMLSCPLCRGDFCTPAQLAEEARNAPDVATSGVAAPGKARALRQKAAAAALAALAEAVHRVSCACCAACPVVGVLYRCAACPQVRMCAACAASPRRSRLHAAHGLVVKKRPEDGWHHVEPQEAAPARLPAAARTKGSQGADAAGRSQRCLRVGGDAGNPTLTGDVRPCHVRQGSKLLLPGQQCLLCLAPYKMKQSVGRLPCGHHFHARCLCEWLRTSTSCPLDGTPLRGKPPPPGDDDATSHKERASRSPASLCVRRLDLADRRDGSRSARSQSPRPSYQLHDHDVWTDADHVSDRRLHAALPARPLGGQQRLLGGHPRRPARVKPVEEQVRRSPTHLSVRSLALPDDAGVGVGVGVVLPCRTSAKEVRRRARTSDLTSERLRGLDLMAASDVGDLVDVKCLRMRLAERRLPK